MLLRLVRSTTLLIVALLAIHLEGASTYNRRRMNFRGIEFTRACADCRGTFYPSPLDARLRGGGTNTDNLRLDGSGAQKPIHEWDEEDVGAFLRGVANIFQNTTDSYAGIFR